MKYKKITNLSVDLSNIYYSFLKKLNKAVEGVFHLRGFVGKELWLLWLYNKIFKIFDVIKDMSDAEAFVISLAYKIVCQASGL